MIRVNQIKVRAGHGKDRLLRKAAEFLRIPPGDILEMKILRQSLDARKKPELFYSYSLALAVRNEERLLQRFRGKENLVSSFVPTEYQFPRPGSRKLKTPPVIAGMGPAGLFCGYFLALHGYRPILLERGRCVEERQKDVERFWETGILDPASNVQFGEGGAGTFSDGKLNTLVRDPQGRNRIVLETFVRFGAKESICYEAKPHIGTDVLRNVVRNMRNEIVRLGGEVRFQSQVTDVEICGGRVCGARINGRELLPCEQLVLAVGHSARDTFSMLYDRNVPMEAKAFAVGLRVVHPQKMINESQYGREDPGEPGAAAYKVTARAADGRGVYSFCMCPGGYVVNASSEEGGTVVNGMSYSGRNGETANSAVIVSVTPEDFGSSHPLAGIEFQRRLERRAYELGGGKIPAQRYGEFRERVLRARESAGNAVEAQRLEKAEDILEETRRSKRPMSSPEEQSGKPFGGEEPLQPQCKGAYVWADVSAILPAACREAFVDGMEAFGRQIRGFDRPDTILLGVESRTSSPVRIHRDDSLQSRIEGLYPCGEGAGYAGGITSAAMDGIRTAEAIAAEYAPWTE
ncbi:MAG: FAD-dependent oxidoreductase [Roseburia sp.]|nr:FAD-dependent oxidoreductase [Roseburia sp.]MCM1097406.1 FAD-dependent oxidoreductase [Ruminococcus flavefaciens]